MSESREESPDWLRSFQAHKSSTWALSSDSESCLDSSLLMEEKSFRFKEKGSVEDGTLIGREGKTTFKKASEEKSPKKGLKLPKKEKDINNNVKSKGNDDPEIAEESTAENGLYLNFFFWCV